MREVIPQQLWIGNARDARDVKGVMALGIEVVIDLAMEEPSIQFPRDVVYCRFPLLDGEGNTAAFLRSIIDTTANFVSAKQPTLVAAVVAKVQSVGLDAAVERVTATGPCDFSPKLWNDVRRTCEHPPPHSLPSLNLIVIRSLEPSRTVGFYESLGIRFQEEQHGKGPIHWAADLNGVVLEVYPAKTGDEVDRTTRLGFVVEDAASLLETLRSSGIEMASELKESQWGLRAVVKDPDGRLVELVQR